MVRLQGIQISGTEWEINPPVIIGDDEEIVIRGDGKVLWSRTGKQLAQFNPDPKCILCNHYHAPWEQC